jgi:hypothetical protein
MSIEKKPRKRFDGAPNKNMSYQIVLPKFDNEGHRISTDELRRVAEKLSKHFGGVTVKPKMIGCYQSSQGETKCDENAVFTAIRMNSKHKQDVNDKLFIERLAKKLAIKFGQESVMITVEDEPDTVSFVVGSMKESIPEYMRDDDYFKQLVD